MMVGYLFFVHTFAKDQINYDNTRWIICVKITFKKFILYWYIVCMYDKMHERLINYVQMLSKSMEFGNLMSDIFIENIL